MNELTGHLEGATTNPAPRIEVYRPAPERRNGMGLVIFPGGGYGHLAEHEGKGYADFYVEAGITCFVVSYRLGPTGHRHPAMLEDALAAIATVRGQAGEFSLHPDRIGVIGSSAGGHLAAHASVAYDRYASPISLRPDFAILCYPVIAIQTEFGHTGSRANLLGEDPTPEQLREISCEAHVTPQTPPCFIWHTEEDPGVPVENSILFASALRRNGVPFELHIYERGRHGLGLNTELTWGNESLRWLQYIEDREDRQTT